ncbi:MAG: excinuclease ABC subunit UvrC [Clostridia bacterium]|nr:excinuclease ABC subunit UvrC [Clostridia bacterium]
MELETEYIPSPAALTAEEPRLARLREKANQLPFSPGVYIMRDKHDKVIYVGKSKVLKNRVSQYFHERAAHTPKTARMVSNVEDFEYILCDSEMEALTLENSLIKLHTPKYNIRLKDDKNYPYIRVTMNDAYPTVTMVRKRTADGARYFGPYSSAQAVAKILVTIRKSFGIAACKKSFPRDIGKTRPCIYAQIGQCVAPCTGKVSSEQYREIFRDITSMLRGSFEDVKRSLTEKMENAAENLEFEAAAIYRDRIESLSKLWQKQKVVASPDAEQDIIGIYRGDTCACIAIFYVRGGCLIDSEHFCFGADQIMEDENLSAFLSEFYTMREFIPREVLLGFDPGEEELSTLASFLSEKAGRKITVRIPERGDGRKLCEMASDNAEQNAKQYRHESERDAKTLIKLTSMLGLEVIPERIEAYDISNLGSEHITAGMIVCENGKFIKKDYRTFTIRDTMGAPDDYASMKEALRRRLDHILNPTGSGFGETPPDLILLDGGKGHVSTVQELMDELGLDIPVLGMVKDEFHKTRALTDGEHEINIAREQSVFVYIYKIQEEVHRYTVSRMMGAKNKTLKTSSLETIDGIGAAKAKALLAHFKSLSAVKAASKDELCEVPGISPALADKIIGHFDKK